MSNHQSVASSDRYKNNKLPFTLLAQRLPLRTLRKTGANSDALLAPADSSRTTSRLRLPDSRLSPWSMGAMVANAAN